MKVIKKVKKKKKKKIKEKISITSKEISYGKSK